MELSSVNPNVPMPAHVSSLFAFDWKLVVTVTRIRTNHLCWDRYRKGTDLLQCRFTYSIMLEDSKKHLSECGQNEDTCAAIIAHSSAGRFCLQQSCNHFSSCWFQALRMQMSKVYHHLCDGTLRSLKTTRCSSVCEMLLLCAGMWGHAKTEVRNQCFMHLYI